MYAILGFIACRPPEPNRQSLESMSEMHIRSFAHPRKTAALYPSLTLLDELCANSSNTEYTFFYLRDRIKRKTSYAESLPTFGIAKTNYIVEFTSAEAKQKTTFSPGTTYAGCDIQKEFFSQKTLVRFKTYEAAEPDNLQYHQDTVYWMNVDDQFYLINSFDYIVHNDIPFQRRR